MPAYLTNPSEASFRIYLTELAFRRHFSRFYDADTDTEHHQHESANNDSGLHLAAKRQPSLTKHPSVPPAQHVSSFQHLDPGQSKQSNKKRRDVAATQALSASDGFHFANRATIGMRTPGHVFRSLGLCTIAAIPIVSEEATTAPITNVAVHRSGKTPGPESPSIGKEPGDEVTLAGKWFIGAFGKWWLGGTLQLRQQTVASGGYPNPHKALEKGDRFTAGVLSFRALDFDPITEGVLIFICWPRLRADNRPRRIRRFSEKRCRLAERIRRQSSQGGGLSRGAWEHTSCERRWFAQLS